MRTIKLVLRKPQHRSTIYPSYIPAYGLAFWCIVWMTRDNIKTIHLNGRLVARTATYQGV